MKTTLTNKQTVLLAAPASETFAAATHALAADRSGELLRGVIETDAHIRAGEYLAALGAAAAVEANLRQLTQVLTVIRDVDAHAEKEARAQS